MGPSFRELLILELKLWGFGSEFSVRLEGRRLLGAFKVWEHKQEDLSAICRRYPEMPTQEAKWLSKRSSFHFASLPPTGSRD